MEFKGRKFFALSVKVSVSDCVYNIYHERKRQVCKSQESTIGITGMVCISLPDIRKEFYYFSSDNYFYYGRLYGIVRVLIILDILVLLTALLLEKKQYRRRTFYLYLGYILILQFTAVADYVIDTWYLQNLAIFFSSMIIFLDNMTQVSDQWLDAKKELLLSEYRASHDVILCPNTFPLQVMGCRRKGTHIICF